MSGPAADQSLVDFLAAYEPPPEDYDRHQQNPVEIAQNQEHFAKETAPILADLRAHGYQVAGLDELNDADIADADAVPVLVEWLARSTDTAVVHALARLLSSHWARAAALPALIALFPTLDDSTDPQGRIRFRSATCSTRSPTTPWSTS